MGKARVCDVCGQIVTDTRKIVKVLNHDVTKDAHDARIVQTWDMHEHCFKKVEDFIADLKKGAK